MVAPVVEHPLCKSISLQFLLAHAEQPTLLRSSKTPLLRGIAERQPFYNEFIHLVGERLPEYTEERLFNTSTFMPQRDYHRILACFKEITGIQNPLHYRELGRVIPAVGDALPQLASTAAGPDRVIQLSPRYNDDFNNDQEIVVERLERTRYDIRATIQHYFLPRLPDNPPYFEMVTAALGYWEGIPLLWGYPLFGETQLIEVQLPLEELVQRDYSYLRLNYHEHNEDVFVNGKKVGRKRALADVLSYEPREEYLAQPLSAYHPVEIIEDVVVDGETIFPKGTHYGMPSNRYHLTLPRIGLGRRIASTFGILPSLIKKKSDYRILVSRSPEAVISESLYATQFEAERRLQAEVQVAKSRAYAAEGQLLVERQVSGINLLIGRIKTLAHDSKNTVLGIDTDGLNLLESISKECGHPLPDHLFDNEETITAGIERLLADEWLPGSVRRAAEYVKRTRPKLHDIIRNERDTMSGGLPVQMEQVSYWEIIQQTMNLLQPTYPQVRLVHEPVHFILTADQRLLKAALTNLIQNAMEASMPNGQVEIAAHQVAKRVRTYTIIEITQSGMLSSETADRLNQQEQFTTKPKGNGRGAVASYDIIKGYHHGSIQYTGLGERGGRIGITF